VARIQINKEEIISVSSTRRMVSSTGSPNFPIVITDINRLIAKILVYSAMKINANEPLLYSTLKPDTSSDSPSAKSKGVRLVSAKLVMNHIKAANGINRSTDLY